MNYDENQSLNKDKERLNILNIFLLVLTLQEIKKQSKDEM